MDHECTHLLNSQGNREGEGTAHWRGAGARKAGCVWGAVSAPVLLEHAVQDKAHGGKGLRCAGSTSQRALPCF